MSDYEKLEEKYNQLLKETHDVVKLKLKIKNLEKELEKKNRIIDLRNIEINELNILLSQKLEGYNGRKQERNALYDTHFY